MGAAANRMTDGKPTLVVGLGLTGWSVVRFLKSRGEDVVVTDSREAPPYLDALRTAYPDVPLVDWNRGIRERAYGGIVASPGMPVPGEEVIGDVELFAREARAPVVAVTGSNGKSTVTMLVQRMLDGAGTRALAGGNIGTPVLDLLARPVPDFYVLELSSFQLETTRSLRPAAAVVLNLSEDHMDRYGSMDEYLAAKLRVYDGAACRVFSRDDPRLAQRARRDADRTFGLGSPEDGGYGVVHREGERWLARGGALLAPVSALSLQGEQNVSNMLAALALVEGALGDGAPDRGRIDAGLAYEGLPHRCELVPTGDGIRWINDSKGTNVGATLAAIGGVGRPLVLIAGGQGKGADFSPLKAAMDQGVRAVLLIGEDAGRIERSLDLGERVRCEPSLADAVSRARRISRPGDTVLFSPACASFDMFDDYAHRGECFRRLVAEGTER